MQRTARIGADMIMINFYLVAFVSHSPLRSPQKIFRQRVHHDGLIDVIICKFYLDLLGPTCRVPVQCDNRLLDMRYDLMRGSYLTRLGNLCSLAGRAR